MLLEGKATGVAVVGLATMIAAFTALPMLAQDVILAAAAITALKVVWNVVSRVLEWAHDVHDATTSELPERMDRVEEQMEAGRVRFASIEATLETFALSERAAVRGALEATRQPRSARVTDPGVRTGWRE